MFTAIDYDIPPPPEDEVVYFRRPVLVFDDPDYGFPPPPSPPVFFLPPPPPDFVVLAPPPPVFAAFVLPVPDYVPMPAYYSPPPYVAPPPPNVIYNNIHNTVVINTTTNMVTITKPGGEAQTVTPAQALASQPVSVNQTAASPTACRTGNVRRAECSEHHSHTVARDSRGGCRSWRCRGRGRFAGAMAAPTVARPAPPPKAHPTPQATKPCVQPNGQPCKR
jgi:hypothetical protein